MKLLTNKVLEAKLGGTTFKYALVEMEFDQGLYLPGELSFSLFFSHCFSILGLPLSQQLKSLFPSE
jgi:hypothetical protein